MEQRRQAIVEMVDRFGTVGIEQLRREFPEVSEVTLRKDLKYLDENQQLIRTHGAAKSLPSVLNYYYRSNVKQAEKKLIAKKAAALIRPGDSIFLAPGTTCAELAKLLPNFELSVCSDGIYTVSCIPCLPKLSVELLGGEVDLNVMRVESAAALDRIDELHFDICFSGAFTLHPDLGPSYMTPMAAAMMRRAFGRADKVVLLADSSKLSLQIRPHRLPISKVDILVGDDKIDPEMAERILSKGIQIL